MADRLTMCAYRIIYPSIINLYQRSEGHFMTTGLNEQTYLTTKSILKAPANGNILRRQFTMTCPRCIGGKMFRDYDEYVCIQCGHSYKPATVCKIAEPTVQN